MPIGTTSPSSVTVDSPEALAARAQRGDAKSWDELVRRMEPRVRGFLLKRVGTEADADDVLQETFIKAQKNLGRYDSTYRFSTWLFTIAGNLATSHFRAAKRHAAVGGDRTEGLADSKTAAGSLADRDEGALLWKRASVLLKPKQYLTLWLRYGEDLEVDEIAQKIGASRVAVRVSLYRARRRLEAELVRERQQS